MESGVRGQITWYGQQNFGGCSWTPCGSNACKPIALTRLILITGYHLVTALRGTYDLQRTEKNNRFW